MQAPLWRLYVLFALRHLCVLVGRKRKPSPGSGINRNDIICFFVACAVHQFGPV